MIPKIIHQTWKTSSLPEQFHTYRETWIRHHPQWEYRFYDDAACRTVVQNAFPDLLTLYDRCLFPIQRADIFRYLVIAAEGGLYADLDMECYKNMETLLDGKEARFFNRRHPQQIANCIFAAKKNHPVFTKIMDEIALRLDGRFPPDEVIETTGPGMLSDVVHLYQRQYDLHILPRICWIPPTRPDYPNIFPFNLHMYAKHHFSGTWKDNNGKNGKAFVRPQGRGFPERIKETLFDIRELYYKLPPSPVWREDFFPGRKNPLRSRQ
jgi:mannosyltransferase OCH1-like enzyme